MMETFILLLNSLRKLTVLIVPFVLIVLSGDVEPNPGFKCLADIKKMRGLKIVHLNICSLHNKIDSLRLELQGSAIDIMTLSETWLNPTIQDMEIQLTGYTCVRRNREGHKTGGGVIIYIRDGLPFVVTTQPLQWSK